MQYLCQRNLPQKEAAEYGIEEFPKLVVFENGIPNLYDGGFTDGQVTIIICNTILFFFLLLSFLSVGFPAYVMADSLICGQVTAIVVFGFQNGLATLNDVT